MVFIGDDSARRKDVEGLIEAHDAERTRIAGALHDDIGQRMAVLGMDLDALAQTLPRRATVALRGSPEEIRLEIVDTGVGFDRDAVLSGRALGLIGMQERVRLVS